MKKAGDEEAPAMKAMMVHLGDRFYRSLGIGSFDFSFGLVLSQQSHRPNLSPI